MVRTSHAPNLTICCKVQTHLQWRKHFGAACGARQVLDHKAYFCAMASLLMLSFFLSFGVVLQRTSLDTERIAQLLNGYIIYLVLPALALLYIPQVQLRMELLWPVASAWISFGLAWLTFGLCGKWWGWHRGTTGCLIITCGLANTSFVGFPVVQALYGADGLKIALLIDQAGSFLLVGTLALVVAAIYGEGHKRKRDIAKNILRFPPFIFFLVGLLLNVANIRVGGFAEKGLEWIALSLSPAALTAVGLQIKLQPKALRNGYLWAGLGYKLMVIPLLICLLFYSILGLRGLLMEVSVIEAAMPPMITGSIIAIAHRLDPPLASLLVEVGIPLAAITLSFWFHILEQLP